MYEVAMRYVFMRFPGGRAKAVTFSYDDGVKQDKRLADLFSSYGIKGTFNFNSTKLREFNYSREEMEEIFFSHGHEIATHGSMHRANGNVRVIEGIREVLDCRLELEERTGRIIRGMAYPDSGINRMGALGSYEEIRSYLKELGIAYSRTLAGDNDSFELPTDFYAWMPSAHHKNPKLREYIESFLSLDISVKRYAAARTSRLLYIWGHSYEFDRDDNWELIEGVCESLAGREDIWYATNIEICDYINAYKSLIYSADGRRIYNPTLYEIWLDVDGVMYSVLPGETLVLDGTV